MKESFVEDVLEAGKHAGPSGITVDLLKMCEKQSILTLTMVANDLLNGKICLKVGKRVI